MTKCTGSLPEGKTSGACELCFRNCYRSNTDFAASGIRHMTTPKGTVERRRAAAEAAKNA